MKYTRLPPLHEKPSQSTTAATRRAVHRAVLALGSQSALAEAVGVSQPAVNNWLNGRRGVTPEVAVRIEAATVKAGSPVMRNALRPDIFGRG